MNRVNRSAKYATAIVVAHLLVNIAHGLAHRELRVGLSPFGSLFVIVVCAYLSFDRSGAGLDSGKTTRSHSPVAFHVRFVVIRLELPVTCTLGGEYRNQ